jgi:Ca2+-transporting ATPase
MWAVTLGTIAGLLLIIYSPLNGFLKLAPLSALQLLMVFGIAAVSVLWYEIVKLIRRIRYKRQGQ